MKDNDDDVASTQTDRETDRQMCRGNATPSWLAVYHSTLLNFPFWPSSKSIVARQMRREELAGRKCRQDLCM